MLSQAAAWPRNAGGLAGRHRAALAALAGVSVLLLAVWAVPPMLDWGRFRGTIASIAAARLGRPVSIGGEVTLRLLPRAVLTAADVTLPDQGDGVSATIASLRLEVAVVPLLAGRLAPRDLVLGSAVLHLPWPLPETLAAPRRPSMPRAFAAHLDNGTLLVGGARIDGINAALHSGPEAPAGFGPLSSVGAAQGFGAEGFAAFAGRSWRFTSALGAPDADGVSALDLAVSGRGPAAHTDAKVQGTLADGVLQGRLVAGGPDLSLLLPASALAWRAEAPFVADGARITAPSLNLWLGGSPADGAFTLGLARPARLEGRLHATSIDLDGWAGILPARVAAGRTAMPRLTGRIEVSADQATLLGGVLSAVRATLAFDGSSLALRDAAAVLPGAARLTLSGAIADAADGLHVSGPATLEASAPTRTLAWLRPLAPALVDAWPSGVPTQARLAGIANLGPRSLSISGLSGEIDGGQVTGGVGIELGAHPHLGLGLELSRLALDPWLGALWPAGSPSLAALGKAAARLDTDIHLRARAASWHGHDVGDLIMDGQTDAGGLAVQHAAFDTGDAHVQASGAVAADGSVSNGTLAVATHGPAGLSDWLPPGWGWAAPVWRGAASLNATLSGPARDLAVQLRADDGDLVLEADGHADPASGRAAGSVTLRHPGAPRVLAALGVAGAERWLGTGSLALRAQVTAAPDHVSIEDFDLRAADLGLSGHMALDRGAADPSWTGTLVASHLCLPDPAEVARLLPGAASGLTVQVDLAATELALGGQDVAERLSGHVALAHGAGLIDIGQVNAFGGQGSGQIAFDAASGHTESAARATLTGAQASALVAGLPVGVISGRANISADLESDGNGPASLSGRASIALRDLTLSGFDAARAHDALARRGNAARAALLLALSQGETAGLSGTLAASLTHGLAVLTPARLASEDEALDISGSADLYARSLDLLFGIAPGVGVRLAGSWVAARAQPMTGPPARHARTH